MRVWKLYKDQIGSLDAMPIREGRNASLFSFDCDTMDFDGYVAPTGWYIFSPVFVPSSKSDVPCDEGYVVALALVDRSMDLPPDSNGSEVWIFDSTNIAKGPITRLANQQVNFGMMLHGVWMETFTEMPRDYMVPTAQDWQPRKLLNGYAEWPAFVRRTPASFRQKYRELWESILQYDKMREILYEGVFPAFPSELMRTKPVGGETTEGVSEAEVVDKPE